MTGLRINKIYKWRSRRKKDGRELIGMIRACRGKWETTMGNRREQSRRSQVQMGYGGKTVLKEVRDFMWSRWDGSVMVGKNLNNYIIPSCLVIRRLRSMVKSIHFSLKKLKLFNLIIFVAIKPFNNNGHSMLGWYSRSHVIIGRLVWRNFIFALLVLHCVQFITWTLSGNFSKKLPPWQISNHRYRYNCIQQYITSKY